MKIPRIALTGVTLAAVGLLLAGCTGTTNGDNNPADANTVALYAELGETTGAWLDTASSDDLNLVNKPKLVTNMAGTCSYNIFYPKVKMDGDVQQTTDNYLKQLAKSKSVEISTKDLKIEGQDKAASFSMATAMGEGKSKTSYLYYLDPNSIQDSQGLGISLAYSCNTEKEWSEKELDGLLEVTKIIAKEAGSN